MNYYLVTSLFATFVLVVILVTASSAPIWSSSNSSDLTGFDSNNTIRNLTNPVLKMERNPLANLSNPLENLSNPVEKLSLP